MAKNCGLCNLEFKNDDQLKQHLDGKRHKKMESLKEERESSAIRSIFVSGLKKSTFVKQLEEHFTQFGKIHKIVQDQEKNAYAIIEYLDEKSVENALNYKEEHRINEKNVKVNRRQVKEFVSRISNKADKKKEILDKLKEEALIVNTLLGKCETFDQQVDQLISHLELKPDMLKQRQLICHNLNNIFKQFWNESEFQVCIFGSTQNGLATNGSDMDMTILFNDYLKENRLKQIKVPKIIAKQIKDHKHKTGQDSSDSNMADDAEIDENIDLEDVNEDENNNNDTTLKENIIKFFNNKEYKEFIKFEIEHQVKIIGKIIQRQLVDLVQVKTITNTRCPVVRFLHDKANVNCDLSLNNFLAYENSKLIKLYMELEPNLKKLVFIIRYWIKQKNLYSNSRFNSYTIIWLVIFYMQKKNVGFLPTVEELSKMTTNTNLIHGWNCAFESDLNKIKSLNIQGNIKKNAIIGVDSINDMLKGFFEFYSNFSFSLPSTSLVICTRSGDILESAEKSELSKISQYINVQDPFDLSHNLTANVSKNTVERFITECKGSNELLSYSVLPRRSLNKCWGLILLMTKKVLPVLSPTALSKISISGKDLVEKSMLNLKLFDENSEKFTTSNAIEFVMFLLKDCLLFEKLQGDKMIVKKHKRLRTLNQICDKVDLLGLSNSPKRLKTSVNTSDDPTKPSNTFTCVFDENLNNDQSSFEKNLEDEKKFIASYQMNALNNTWQSRRIVKRELKQRVADADDLTLEKLTSLKIIEAKLNQPVNDSKGFNFAIHFLDNNKENGSVTHKPDLTNLQIKFELLDEINSQTELLNFTTLVHFLDIYLNNSFEKMFTNWIKIQSHTA